MNNGLAAKAVNGGQRKIAVKFGMSLPCVMPVATPPWPDDKVVDGIEAVAKKADQLGFEYVACCDHPVIPKEAAKPMGTRWFDPIATLGFAAGITTRVKLLTSVVVLPYRTPFDIAKSMATLDSLSGGRLIFGVGVGHLQREFEALGANFAERGAVTDEYIEIIKALWTNDAATYHGKYWDFEGMMVSPRPVAEPHPPVWVGGNAKAAVRRAILHAEGWHPMQMAPEEYKGMIAYARKVMKESGRTKPMEFNSRIDGIDPGAVSGAKPVSGPSTMSGKEAPYYARAASGPRTAPSITTAEALIARIHEYRDAGATMVNIGFRYTELAPLLESMDWLAQEVMPKVG